MDQKEYSVSGCFNGIELRKITSRKITTTDNGATLYSFRASEFPADLEPTLRLGGPGLLILSHETIEGTIAHYSANAQLGFEVTLKVKT